MELTGDEKPKGFYAFWIWNYEEECGVQVFQFSQQGLIDPIISNLFRGDLQEPHAYDFKLSTNGLSGLDKRYNVACVPGKRRQEKINKEIAAAFQEVLKEGGDLTNLLVGADPFKQLDF